MQISLNTKSSALITIFKAQKLIQYFHLKKSQVVPNLAPIFAYLPIFFSQLAEYLLTI